VSELQAAARALGLQLHVLHASTERDFDTVFATLVRLRPGALVIGPDSLFVGRNEQLAELALRHAVPAIFQDREFAAAGGCAAGSLFLGRKIASVECRRRDNQRADLAHPGSFALRHHDELEVLDLTGPWCAWRRARLDYLQAQPHTSVDHRGPRNRHGGQVGAPARREGRHCTEHFAGFCEHRQAGAPRQRPGPDLDPDGFSASGGTRRRELDHLGIPLRERAGTGHEKAQHERRNEGVLPHSVVSWFSP
jgi:hypothetical protein